MPTAKTGYGRIAATITVTDMPRATAFYTEVLGLTKAFENGSPVGFVILTRDAAELHLTLSKTHQVTDRNVAHLLVADATKLHDHLTRHGVRIVKGLRDADYGLRNFVFADPDGNRIDVGQQLKPAQPARSVSTSGDTAELGRAIIFAKHLKRMLAFYNETLGLPVIDDRSSEGWVELAAGSVALALQEIPAAIAEGISLTAPPQPREEAPIKLVFWVPDVERERARLLACGVQMLELRAWGACDGIDPEGNVFQIAKRRRVSRP
jgi:catechol 2,3-dioxygenase-like lactoylglutathione lyase family enzyme